MSITIREYIDGYTDGRRVMGLVNSVELLDGKHSIVVEEWNDGSVVFFWNSVPYGGVVERMGFLSAQSKALEYLERGSMA